MSRNLELYAIESAIRETFPEFLERIGFQADACESCIEPDFYRLAETMHNALQEALAGTNDMVDSIRSETVVREALGLID